MRTLAREFRRRGKTVIVGGSQATLTPRAFRSDCDILVRGELEQLTALPHGAYFANQAPGLISEAAPSAART